MVPWVQARVLDRPPPRGKDGVRPGREVSGAPTRPGRGGRQEAPPCPASPSVSLRARRRPRPAPPWPRAFLHSCLWGGLWARGGRPPAPKGVKLSGSPLPLPPR